MLIADDGLQHYALRRDVEIVLFDGRGAGNGWLLPAGPLREPASRRRDFTVVNAPELDAATARPAWAARRSACSWPASMAERAGRSGAARRRWPRWPAQRIVAAAGIGNPGRFFAMLRAAGLTSPSWRCPTITISSTSLLPRSTPTSS